MLRFENLAKRYDNQPVFNGLNHAFGAGCVALQGANGSGKSTLMSMLAGVVQPDAGEIWIAGHSLRTDPLSAKACLAYVPDECPVYPFLSGRAFLELVASTKHTRVDAATLELVEHFRLQPHLEIRFEQMSLGTRKKMLLAAVLLGAPSVIIADEPSNGLDANAKRVLAALFQQLGKTAVVLFSTHDPEFAAACDARTIGFSALENPVALPAGSA